jgi:hypothetical protein
MSLLARLIGKAFPPSAAGAAAHDLEHLRTDLQRLDRVKAGLGKGLIRYVARGENDSVLLTLARHKAKAMEAMRHQFWSSSGQWTPGRSDFLLGAREWRPKAVRRYGVVLDVIFGDNNWPKPPGSALSPGWFRNLLRFYGDARTAVQTGLGFGRENRPPKNADRLPPWTVERLRELLVEDFTPIVDAAFEREEGWTRSYNDNATPEAMPDFEAHMRADPGLRVTELRKLSAKGRSQALRYLARQKIVHPAYFDFAFDQASGSARSARAAASLLLQVMPDAVLARTGEAWAGLRAAEKLELARTVVAACGEAGVTLLKDLAASETQETVRADLTRILGQEHAIVLDDDAAAPDDRTGYAAVDGSRIAISAPAPPPADTPLTPALEARIREAVSLWGQEAEAHNARRKGEKHFHRQRTPQAGTAEKLIALFNGKAGHGHDAAQQIFSPWGLSTARAAVRDEILGDPDLSLWALVRAVPPREHRVWNAHAMAVFESTPRGQAMRDRLKEGRDLRTFAAMAAACGSNAGTLPQMLLAERYWQVDPDMWQPAAIWPLLAERFDLLDEALGLKPSGSQKLNEQSALELLHLFPVTPARYMHALMERAIGPRKTVRQSARRLLKDMPGLDQVLVPLLGHPKAELREGAASWLAERRETTAIQPLLKAARKEKIPAAKAAMLAAVSQLGGVIGEFVSADALLAEAQAGLKKASLKGLEWFPFDGLPAVRRRDGQMLDPLVVRWWVVLAVKLKLPGGNPWFELLLDELDPADAARLGLSILQAFVGHDARGLSEEEANAHAAANVDAVFRNYQRFYPDWTREQVFTMLRNQKLKAYLGSANDQKGMLGLTVRASGPDAVAIARTYLRDHYGRTAQCKALIQALAGNPSPVAIQFVLSIAKRWRTHGVQELAGQLVEEIAERRGWSAEQLADRTIPTGGFDARGVLELPVGDRVYTARLDATGKLTVFNPDGKPVQALPASAPESAAQDLKDAKASLSSARKEAKQVKEFQTRRLYEALYVERIWPREDWDEHLLRHPLVGRLIQRLVWLALDERGERIAVFRPLDDLSLTDAADAAVDAAGFASVRLAHATALSPQEIDAWVRHLEDYAVEPLFDQLSRPVIAPDVSLRDETRIVDRRGWMIESFRLRGAATKLGWLRGEAADAGVFVTYEKRFDGLGLTAEIEFTGSSLPEENHPVALVALRFAKTGKGGGWLGGGDLKLAQVPRVLLSETWNDLHVIAAAGSGFDPEWERKATW